MGKSRKSHLLTDLDRLKWSVAYKGIIAGVISGLLVSLYRRGIEFGTEKAIQAYEYLGKHPALIVPWLAVIAAAGYILYKLIQFEPYAKGSGIPQVEGVVLYGMQIRWYTVLAVRFLAGTLSSFFGVSLGREGPSIQIGASGAQAMASCLSGKNKLEKNCLITAGASAGLSAAFNAPLSGIVFALEEVHRTFSPIILIAATSAALTADVVSKYFFGLKPVLSYGAIPQLPISCYALLIPLGILCGIVGVIANRGLLGVDKLYRRLPARVRPGVALLIALPCGLFLPEVLGGGQNLIRLSEGAQAGVFLLALYLAAKLIFTCLCFGSGIPGGIFMPILAMGALTGSLFARGAGALGLSATYIPAFCVCAMAGVMSGSVKAPVTSILLMAEMTGSLVHLMPVAAVAFLALLTSDLLKTSPIYEVLLKRITPTDEGRRKGAIVEVPVEMGSEVAGKRVRDVAWPEGALIAQLHRGAEEIVPGGDTRIESGDYLVVLTSGMMFAEIGERLREMCRSS